MTENKCDLISREALKEKLSGKEYITYTHEYGDAIPVEWVMGAIDNAPTVEIPENEVNCVLTMFGKCSYNETGCSDCAIKDKIRKALNERPTGDLISRSALRKAFKNHPLCNDVWLQYSREIIDNAPTVKPCENCDLYFIAKTKEEMRKGG